MKSKKTAGVKSDPKRVSDQEESDDSPSPPKLSRPASPNKKPTAPSKAASGTVMGKASSSAKPKPKPSPTKPAPTTPKAGPKEASLDVAASLGSTRRAQQPPASPAPVRRATTTTAKSNGEATAVPKANTVEGRAGTQKLGKDEDGQDEAMVSGRRSTDKSLLTDCQDGVDQSGPEEPLTTGSAMETSSSWSPAVRSIVCRDVGATRADQYVQARKTLETVRTCEDAELDARHWREDCDVAESRAREDSAREVARQEEDRRITRQRRDEDVGRAKIRRQARAEREAERRLEDSDLFMAAVEETPRHGHTMSAVVASGSHPPSTPSRPSRKRARPSGDGESGQARPKSRPKKIAANPTSSPDV
jgi:hypothetical protein